MSRRMVLAAVLAASLSVFILVPAHAKPLSPNYATLKFGGYFPQHGDLDGFGSGFNGEIALGRIVAPGFAVEGGLGYFESTGDLVAPGVSGHEKFKVVPLTLSLKGQTFFEQFEPYAGIGIGAYFIEDEFSGTAPGISGSRSENGAEVGFHVVLGGNYNVTRHVFFGLEGKYLWLKSDRFGGDVRLDGITLTGNIGFRF